MTATTWLGVSAYCAPMGTVQGNFPNAGLVYPKADEKLPFMTWVEIERRIKAGGKPAELWECLYFTATEIKKLLEYVKGRKISSWICPMFLTIAHTGARRSEMIRAKVEDVDLAGRTLTIREKKRAKGTRTARRVPLSTPLAAMLRKWLPSREGKPFLFGPGDQPMTPQAAQHALGRAARFRQGHRRIEMGREDQGLARSSPHLRFRLGEQRR